MKASTQILNEQFKQMVRQHAKTTSDRPIASHTTPPPLLPSQPIAAKVDTKPAETPAMAVVPPSSTRSAPSYFERFSVRLTASEIQALNNLIIENQRVGQRLSISDVLRVGLTRLQPNPVITPQEVAVLRRSDARRSAMRPKRPSAIGLPNR